MTSLLPKRFCTRTNVAQRHNPVAARLGIWKHHELNSRLCRPHEHNGCLSLLNGKQQHMCNGLGTLRTYVVARAGPSPQQALGKPDQQAQLQELLKYLGITIGIALASAAASLYIDQFSTTPCTVEHTCKHIDEGLKVALVATHLYSFMLIPATMYVFYNKISELRGAGARSPFTALVGLGYVMVAIAGEIGWHVTQDWYYKEEYAVLNLAFYEFLVLGLSMWAYGIRVDPLRDHPYATKDIAASADLLTDNDQQLPVGLHQTQWGAATDYFLIAAPVLSGILYLLGAEVTHTKVPIYMLMLAVFVVLTNRFYKLLKTRWVLLFPFFSVGVNLGFIALLNKYQTDPVLNPLFHICHDLLGTEMGIAVIGVLTYLRLSSAPSGFDQQVAAAAFAPQGAWKTEYWAGPDGTQVKVNLLNAPKGERRGVVLFLHGFQQTPQNYDAILGALASGGLDIVAPLHPHINTPKKLQEAILANAEVVIKHMSDNSQLTGEVAIAGHSLGGGLTLEIMRRHPGMFKRLALMSPFPQLSAGDPTTAIAGMSTPLDLQALVLMAQLDLLAQHHLIEHRIVEPLRGHKADVQEYTFPFGNHTGYCDSASFFGQEFPAGVLLRLMGDATDAAPSSWFDQLRSWIPPIRISLPAPLTFALIMSALGALATWSYINIGDLSTNGEKAAGVAFGFFSSLMGLELFWVLYYAPYVQGPKTKDLVVKFLLPGTSAATGSTPTPAPTPNSPTGGAVAGTAVVSNPVDNDVVQ